MPINGYTIGVGLNYWDDPESLLRQLNEPSYYRVVDKIYLINGRYAKRDDPPIYDPKLLDEICERFTKIERVDMEDALQIDKRNKYIEMAERDNLDFLIWLDSDEILIFDQDFKESLDECINLDFQCFPIAMDYLPDVIQPRPRLFRRPFNFRHRDSGTMSSISHGHLWTPDGVEIVRQFHKYAGIHGKRQCVKGAYLKHDKAFRSKKRVDMDYLYYENVPNR